ncbi:2-acylglycerol O-acyltransferase 2-B-like [Anabas testudineus]|uniref:2-acylglycerol O-acyltransferase 2-B-like n=1 Tax=Anabas testudineus TaxID=64144 RepID=UPI00143D30A3|nr:2-acylglycerol O-acyltransferase 2-B-like [Anabas testudineus]
MKIEFAPLNIPLRRRLQTAAVLQWVFSFLALAQVCLAAFVLLALSDWWILALLYAGWLWLDWDTPSSGGRRSRWVRSWTVWEQFRDYFPITLLKTVDLDPKKNYIFGFHPHGVLVAGGFGNFCTEATGFCRLFPGLTSHLLMLPFWFRVPVFRDYIMCGEGLVSSSKSSLSYLVSRPEGGNVAVIAVGGAPEALDARPGALTLQVLNRKGFIKLALKHGAQLVPVFSFGENELFDLMENPSGSPLRRLQDSHLETPRLQGSRMEGAEMKELDVNCCLSCLHHEHNKSSEGINTFDLIRMNNQYLIHEFITVVPP